MLYAALTGVVVPARLAGRENMTAYEAPARRDCRKVAGVRQAHLELYKYMKERYENNENFNKEDLLKIYNSYVIPTKRLAGNRRLTEEQVYNNASTWLNRAISILVRHGYLGLTFRKNEKQENLLWT